MIVPSLLLAVSFLAAQTPSPGFKDMTETQIAQTLRAIHAANSDLNDRVAAVSRAFLGIPYQMGKLGEGPQGEFDRDPLYSFRLLDCTTLVEEVMALSLEPDLNTALQTTLQNIRYKDGHIAYEDRNHFTAVDWVPNNVAAGYLEDITQAVGGSKARVAHKKISKREWYLHMSTSSLEGFTDAAPDELLHRAKRLQALGANIPDSDAQLPYVSVSDLAALLDRLPSGTIANLVRADLPDKPDMISHQILLVRENATWFVRHAAFGKEVQDVPFLDYFKRYDGSKWPLLGLNLNALRSPKH